MSELPDLDTTEVGLTAYWNAIDDGEVGASGLNIPEVIEYDNLTGWESYDNGIEGTLELGFSNFSTLELNFRIKSDGWHVVWNERGTDFQYSMSGISPSNDTLWYDVLEEMADLTASTATFNQGDCGLYDYNYEPDELWLFYEYLDYAESDAYIYFESPSTLERADGCMYAYAHGYTGGFGPVVISDEEDTVTTELNLDPETVYESHIDITHVNNLFHGENSISLLISR